ncbi:diacylglycerol/lipid kinase family protein [Opitutus terrae]|uniref:Diacylglycerol kinase catalytic region n=1 Tax=Opitutus terrae (strain DSM 11246 / JCM 15787 / PB90-1) TaxID=452637 RepID=B1ZZA5_OPITP|nr:diacylglycerol kinase family protein [Opitutus terrae]ACB77174.1 diacylglycerol kinase catalytic region [Opitutus terrae PB90-1]
MNAILILNPQAGALAHGAGDAASPIKLHDAFAAAGVDVALRPVNGDELGATVAAAVAQKPEAIFVGGGDGTISAAAAHLVDTGVPLGVLPLGTLNHFARDLGVPTPWREAVVALACGQVRHVDVGEVNGRIFINNCSIGSYAEAVRRRDALRSDRGHGKWRAMLLASFSVFRELRRIRLHLNLPHQALDLRTPFLLVANNRYSGHVLESSLRDRLDQGQLWFYSTRARGRADVLRLVWQTLVRELDDADALDVQAASTAVLSSPQASLPVAADGELLTLHPPLQLRIRPGALSVLAPAPAGTG